MRIRGSLSQTAPMSPWSTQSCGGQRGDADGTGPLGQPGHDDNHVALPSLRKTGDGHRRQSYEPLLGSASERLPWGDRARSYSSSSQFSTAGPGLANMMSSSLASFARTFPVSRYSMTSPGLIEESMRTRIGESVRLMI